MTGNIKTAGGGQKRALAILSAAVFLAVSFSVVIDDGAIVDADPSDSWKCTIEKITSNADIRVTYTINDENQSVTGVTGSSGATSGTAWEYNETTGYGPFNSFYAAFNDSGDMICHLNPKDLTKSLDGNTSVNGTEISSCNIMWCIPKFYAGVDSVGTITFGSDSSIGDVYPAFTITSTDKKGTYNYLAIGVYEATKTSDIIGSRTGVAPYESLKLDDYITGVQKIGSNSIVKVPMIWNYYQMQLYRMCSIATTQSINSQSTIGDGNAYTKGASNTGLLDTKGPYYGEANYNSSVKLFIENAWGSLAEYVADTVYDSTKIYAGQNYNPSITTKTDKKEILSLSDSGKYWGTPLSTNLNTWGTPTILWRSNSNNSADGFTATNSQTLTSGGMYTDTMSAGLLCMGGHISGYTKDNAVGIGSRIAFLFNKDPGAPTNTLTLDPGSNISLSYGGTTYALGVAFTVFTSSYTLHSDDKGKITFPNGGSIEFSDTSIADVNIDKGGYITVGSSSSGHHFDYWKSGTNTISYPSSGTETYKFTGNLTFAASTYIAYDLTIEVGSNGTLRNSGSVPVDINEYTIDANSTVTISDFKITFTPHGGAETTLKVTPNAGYRFKELDINSNKACTFAVTENTKITAQWVQTFNLTVATDGNGTIASDVNDYYGKKTNSTLTFKVDTGTTPSVSETNVLTLTYVSDESKGTTGTASITPSSSKLSDGYKLSGWSSSKGAVTDPIIYAKTVTALFDTYKITFTSDKNGSVTASSAWIAKNEQIRFEGNSARFSDKTDLSKTSSDAKPLIGYRFYTWSNSTGDAIVTDSTKTASKSVTGPTTYSAQFKKTYNLTINAGEGGSIDNGGAYTVDSDTVMDSSTAGTLTFKAIVDSYPTNITITATPTPGAHKEFKEWSDLTSPVSSDETITATFQNEQFEITVKTGPGYKLSVNGSTISSNSVKEYDYSTLITVNENTLTIGSDTYIVTANSHYYCDEPSPWSISSSTVTDAGVYEPSFYNAYYLKVEAGEGSSLSQSTPASRYLIDASTTMIEFSKNTLSFTQHGSRDKITVTVIADDTHRFYEWSSTSTTMSDDGTITSMMKSVQTLTLSVKDTTGNGTLSYSGGINGPTFTVDSDVKYTESGDSLEFPAFATAADRSTGTTTAVTVTANGSTGYHFSSWEGDSDGSSSVEAAFEIYDVTFKFGTGAKSTTAVVKKVALSDNDISWDGNKATLRVSGDLSDSNVIAEYDSGYRFLSWDSAPTSISGPTTVTASFQKIRTLTLNVGANGTVDPATTQYEVDDDTQLVANIENHAGILKFTRVTDKDRGTTGLITISAAGNAGYGLTSWGDTTKISGGDRTLNVLFGEVRIQFDSNGNGTVDTTEAWVTSNTMLTFNKGRISWNNGEASAEPNSGYRFSDWTNGPTTGSTAVTAPIKYTANFTSVYYITFNVASGGSIKATVSPTDGKYMVDSDVVINYSKTDYKNDTIDFTALVDGEPTSVKITASKLTNAYVFKGWNYSSTSLSSNYDFIANFTSSSVTVRTFDELKDALDGNCEVILVDGTFDIDEDIVVKSDKSLEFISGTCTVTSGSKITVQEDAALVVRDAAKLINAGTVNINGDMSVRSEYESIGGTTSVTGTMSIPSGGKATFDGTSTFVGASSTTVSGSMHFNTDPSHVKEILEDLSTIKAATEVAHKEVGSLTVSVAPSGTLPEDVTVPSGTELVIESGTELTIPSGKKLTVEDGGKLTIEDGATLTNKGSVENSGTLKNKGTYNNDGDTTNKEGADIKNAGTFNNSNSGEIKNNEGGVIENGGSMTNGSDSTIVNSGEIKNNEGGVIENGGSMTNGSGSTIVNSGEIKNNEGGVIENGGSMTNGSGSTIVNSGEIKNNEGGVIDNRGDLNNNGGSITNAEGGVIENEGSMTNGSGSTISNSGSLTISSMSSVDNQGAFTNNGTTTNRGTISNGTTGVVNNSGEITIDSTGVINNSGAVNNNANGTIGNYGTYKNDGTTTNSGGAKLTNSENATLTNNGEFSNDGDLSNDGTIYSPSGTIDGNVSGSGTVLGSDGPKKKLIDDDDDEIHQQSNSDDALVVAFAVGAIASLLIVFVFWIRKD